MRMKSRLQKLFAASLGLTAILASQVALAQLTGTIVVPSVTYPTLASAITALNAQGVGPGGVTINVTAPQTAPASGYLITASGSGVRPEDLIAALAFALYLRKRHRTPLQLPRQICQMSLLEPSRHIKGR